MAATFEITQRLGSLATVYDIAVSGESEPSLTVKGTFATATPKFELLDKSGAVLCHLKGNVVKTKFSVTSPKGDDLATLNFTAVSLQKALTMTVGGKGYHAKAGLLGGTFDCADNDGNVALSIVKEEGIRDKFRVEVKGDMSREVAILAAVAIHSRFYE